jgi:alpha-galactosidase
MKKLLFLSAFILCILSAKAQTNNTPKPVSDAEFMALAPTPPMGWNSWNKFGCNVSEKLICGMADAMVSSGMKDVGYQYIVIDDCWQVGRDADGNIIADKDRFPHGIKYVADYIHSKGLKFGIYSDGGTLTCAGRPGSRGYQFQDARQYAKWGVDFLKYDWCNNKGQKAEAAYKTMSDALKATGRPIVFSICTWGQHEPWNWEKGIGQMWRATGDIRDFFECDSDWGGLGVLNIIDIMTPLYPYAGPGRWNDPDMLEVGNGGMTTTEYITHMSMWCMFAAPLIAGNDLRSMDATTKAILTNREVIDVDQDPLGKQAKLYIEFGKNKQVFAKPLDNGDVAVCFLNRAETPWTLDFDWKYVSPLKGNITYTIRDLWKHKEIGKTGEKFKASVEPHGVLMLRLKK